MAKVVVGTFKSDKPGSKPNGGKASVKEKRVRDTQGKVKTLLTLNAGSLTFGADLQYVFAKNVAKARRDNKRIIGATDVAVAKR